MTCRFGTCDGSRQNIVLLRALALALLLPFCFSPPSASAQAVYGSVAGTVSDPSGSALPGVTVVITSVDRKTADTVFTKEAAK